MKKIYKKDKEEQQNELNYKSVNKNLRYKLPAPGNPFQDQHQNYTPNFHNDPRIAFDNYMRYLQDTIGNQAVIRLIESGQLPEIVKAKFDIDISVNNSEKEEKLSTEFNLSKNNNEKLYKQIIDGRKVSGNSENFYNYNQNLLLDEKGNMVEKITSGTRYWPLLSKVARPGYVEEEMKGLTGFLYNNRDAYAKGAAWFENFDLNDDGKKESCYFKIFHYDDNPDTFHLRVITMETLLKDPYFNKDAEILMTFDIKTGTSIISPDYLEKCMDLGFSPEDLPEIHNRVTQYYWTQNNLVNKLRKEKNNLYWSRFRAENSYSKSFALLNDTAYLLNIKKKEMNKCNKNIENYFKKNKSIEGSEYKSLIKKQTQLKKIIKKYETELEKYTKENKEKYNKYTEISEKYDKKLKEYTEKNYYRKVTLYNQLEKKQTKKYNKKLDRYITKATLKRSRPTFCNFLATSAFAYMAEKNFPHSYSTIYGKKPLNIRFNKLDKPLSATKMVKYYEKLSKDQESNWMELTPYEANYIINVIDAPILVGWKNYSGGSGHVAILYPGYIPDEKKIFDYTNENKINIFHAGDPDADKSTVLEGFGNTKKKKLHYFIIKEDLMRFYKALENLGYPQF